MDREIYAMIKELATRVQLLENQLVNQKRENANLLEELENSKSSGVSSSFMGQVDKKFSEILQTEEKIQMTVADASSEAKKQYSKLEMTAESISTEVGAIYKEPDALFGKIPDDTCDKDLLYAYYKSNINGDVEHNGGKYKFECYYRYNTISEKWEETDSSSIASQFIQTTDGFKLKGDVAINGNTYQNGYIYVTGQGVEEGSAIYVCNGDINNIVGFISYDTNGNKAYESKNRMIIAANGGNALKIVTYNTGNMEAPNVKNISIGAGMWGGNGDVTEYSGYGYVYVDSPIVFSMYSQASGNPLKDRDVIFQDGCRVDFSDAKVSGLYAVFAPDPE